VRTMLKHFKDSMLQLFPTTKFRIILIVLVMTAAFISVSELAVAKLFTQIILHEGELSTTEIILYILWRDKSGSLFSTNLSGECL
jgi:hypothetical protein